MTIKIEFTPSFYAPCSFEIKKEGEKYRLIIIKSSTDSPPDPGAVWHTETDVSEPIEHLVSMIRNIALPEPPPSYIVIADGTEIKVYFEEEGEILQYRFISPPLGSHKSKLALGALELGKRLIPEKELFSHFDNLENDLS